MFRSKALQMCIIPSSSILLLSIINVFKVWFFSNAFPIYIALSSILIEERNKSVKDVLISINFAIDITP